MLLTGEQVRRYIADGFIVLDANLPADFHADIVDELHFAMQHETPLPGDNLLPRVPAMQRLLAAPAVHGAMASLLGPEFAWAPVGCEGLKRLGIRSALLAAVRYLETYRWDPVHHRFWRAMVKARTRS